MTLNTHTLINTSLSGKVIYQDVDSCHVELNTTESMQVDESGLIHGGFIFSAADYAAMGVINHPYVVLGSAEVRFLKPTKVGETLTFIAGIKLIDGKKTKVKVIGTNAPQEKNIGMNIHLFYSRKTHPLITLIMIQQLQKLQSTALEHLASLQTEEALILYKNSILGKTGELTIILKGLKDLTPEERGTVGKAANDIRDILTEAFDAEKARIKSDTIKARLASEWEDMTVPLEKKGGSLHPMTRVRQDVEDTFTRMGFDIYESMEVTTEYLNFDAVNVPKTHPARDMQDTFWLEGDGNVLATQTSCMQNLIMKAKNTPIRAIIPGRVFRNEDVDATHDNTFYQVEGIVVDKGIGISHLKFTITTMLSDIFGKEVTIRMRPGYFPFVEPGVEVDFSCPFCDGVGCRICKGSGWIEFMGAGLIHPNVIREGGLDPEIYSGFAFGFGLNRLVMIRYGIPDMRYFMSPDVRFLKQF